MTTEATLQALIEPLAAGGCWPVVNTAETVAYPYAVFYEISGVPGLISGTDFERKRFQVDCFGTSYGQAKALAKGIKDAVDSTFESSAFISQMDGDYDPVSKTYQSLIEFYIWSDE